MIFFVIIKALFIGILVGALLLWFSARKQTQPHEGEGQANPNGGCMVGKWSVCANFLKNLLLLALILALPLLFIRIIL